VAGDIPPPLIGAAAPEIDLQMFAPIGADV